MSDKITALKPEVRAQEKLVLRRSPVVKATENDKALVEIDYNGDIPMKEGGKTHVVSYGSFDLIRSDGRPVKLQITAYYK